MKTIDERDNYIKLQQIDYKHKIHGGAALIGLKYDEYFQSYIIQVFRIKEFDIGEKHYITEIRLATARIKDEKKAFSEFENSILTGEFCTGLKKGRGK